MAGGRRLGVGAPFLLTLCGFGGVASMRFKVAFARRSISASE